MANHPHDKTRPESKKVLSALEAGDMDALYAAFSPRMRAFCREYVLDFDGKAAAIRAGYATKYADRQASNLLRNRGIQRYIDHLTLSVEAKIVAIDPDYIVQKWVQIMNKEGVKDNDLLRASELCARYLGMFVDRQEITGRDGEAIKIQELSEEAAALDAFMENLSKQAQKLSEETEDGEKVFPRNNK